MNYLVHLYLSDPSAECLLGTLMGDFVKGPLGDRYRGGVRWGIELHRKVDVFAHQSPAFRLSKNRLDDSFGHCKGVLVDIFYDHFLAKNWPRYASEPLETFAARVYDLLKIHDPLLPDGLREIAPRMIRHDWLVSYREVGTIATVLQRIAARLKRPNPIARGFGELQQHYAGLEEDCDRFLIEAREFVERLRCRQNAPHS